MPMKLAKRSEIKIRASWPLMVLHRTMTGDKAQYRTWKERLEKVLQACRLNRARSPVLRKVIAHPAAWRRARGFGRLGTWVVLGLGGWTTYNITYFYSEFLQFGLWPYLLFLPPLIPAAYVAKRSLENAALASMASTRGDDPGARARSAALSGVFHSFTAGFAVGFVLLFLQGLMSWFLTPAPTLFQELFFDATLATQYGVIMGAFTAPLGLVLGRKAIDPRALPPAPQASVALLTE
jgi:hypothetical protein